MDSRGRQPDHSDWDGSAVSRESAPLTEPASAPHYIIHSDEEPLRLERQARIYGTEDDLRFAALSEGDTVLDAGCGSGATTRLFARHNTRGRVVGLDRNEGYLDFARRQAQAEGLANLEFVSGDVLWLPFDKGQFDVVWSKHLLQWVGKREQALAECIRVTRPGGRVIACNFDGFCLQHHPTDLALQADIERLFEGAREALGFDNNLGRKLPSLFRQAGLENIRVHIGPDKAFCGFGGDPERHWNWEVQWRSARPFACQAMGSEAAADALIARLLRRFNDPGVFVYTTLFHVEGTVPRD